MVSSPQLSLREEHIEKCAEKFLHRHGLIGGWLVVIVLALLVWSNIEGNWLVQNEISEGWDTSCENRFSLWSNTKCREVSGIDFGECLEECIEFSYTDILKGKIVFGDINVDHFVVAETFAVLGILQAAVSVYCLWKPGGRWGTVASTIAIFFSGISSIVVIALVEDSWVYRNSIFGCFESLTQVGNTTSSSSFEYCSLRGNSEYTMVAACGLSFAAFTVLVHACRDAWRDDSPHTIRQLLKARDIAVSGVDLDDTEESLPKLSL